MTSQMTPAPRLSRTDNGRPAAPVRLVHLGLGNFFRAHQAWYTEHAPDHHDWGFAAFTGRSAAMADALRPQDGLYTLITRSADGDRFEVISVLSAVHSIDEHEAWLNYCSRAEVVILTVTITEGGYLRTADGHLDTTSEAVQADTRALRTGQRDRVTTGPGRIVAGLLARRAAGAGPITVLPCDNLPDNGPALARVVDDLIALVEPSLAPWVAGNVSWASSMVDRITPVTTTQTLADVLAATSVTDIAPVATEPFSEWVIQGEFRGGHPAWEKVGARIVPDVKPFEQRKLALLNGAHSLMAYAATIVGHDRVDQAINDPLVHRWVNEYWDEAVRHLEFAGQEIAEYRSALLERFQNPRMRDHLARIAADGSTKLPIRVVPTLRAELAEGRVPTGTSRIVAAWVLHLRGFGAPVNDVQSTLVAQLGRGNISDTVSEVIGYLGQDLTTSSSLNAQVLAAVDELIGTGL